MSPEHLPTTSQVNGTYWGSAAVNWAEIQEQINRPLYEAVFNYIGLTSSHSYLDAGCGSGLALQIAAERGARVSGFDAAANLIGIARSRVPNADLRVGDLETIPFTDASFDLVTGFNSFQYAARPKNAVREAKRVAKPDAQIVIVVWGLPDGMPAASVITALRPLLPPPPPGAPGPFALSNETALRALASDAGLVSVDLLDVQAPLRYPDLATALKGLGSSGVAARAIEHAGAQAVDDAHSAALASFCTSDGSYEVGATFRCLIARA